MKKKLALALATGLIMGMLPVSAALASDSTVTVEDLMGTVEVPASPERVFVLGTPGLDCMDALGLGEYVVGVQERNQTETTAWLDAYYEDDTIIVLSTGTRGNSHNGEEAEESEDPYEVYYTIDADLIIACGVEDEAYEALCEVAPTVVLQDYSASVDEETEAADLYEVTKYNAEIIGQIWNMEDEVAELFADIDERLAALEEALAGQEAVFAHPDMRTGGIVLNTEDGQLLTKLGVTNLSLEAPEDLTSGDSVRSKSGITHGDDEEDGEDAESTDGGTSGKGGSEDEEEEEGDPELLEAALLEVTDWIEEQDAFCVFIFDNRYTSLDEAAENGLEYPGVRDLTAYQEGRVYFLSAAWRNGLGGISSLENQIADLEAIFLG